MQLSKTMDIQLLHTEIVHDCLQRVFLTDNIKMDDLESDDSDRQGFIPYHIEIQPSVFPREEKEKSPINIFEPHYILGNTMLRKEPPQCYDHFQEIQSTMYSVAEERTVSFQREQNLSAYQTYSNSDVYRCIYSKDKEPFSSGSKLAFDNELVLKDSPHKHFQLTRCLRPWNEDYAKSQSSHDLSFDSKFQGGNLHSAFKSLTQTNAYVLFMQNDTNTYGYNQWFYFAIKNTRPGKVYTFRIANFKKSYSFYKKGMRPVFFSRERAKRTGSGWYRAGFNVAYFPSNFTEVHCSSYFTLQFQVQFEFQEDYVTVSPCPPYSYSRLMKTIKRCSAEAELNHISLKLESVARSLGGNQVPYLILSNQGSYNVKKPSIVILGRQHSGQIWSSYLIQEILLEVVYGRSEGSRWLLQNYNLHIFPMINVDGVIYGNFRCDIVGYDLNRCWKNPSPFIHPHIYKIKELLADLSEASSVDYCFDMHTHSKELGIFAYCCHEDSRAMPLLLSKMTSLFRYRSCTFGISKDKKQTARAALFEMTKNANIVTVQMSSFGVKRKNQIFGQPFSGKCMNSFAKVIIEALFYQKSGNENKIPSFLQIQRFEIDDSQDSPVSGSDSQPEADEIEVNARMKKVLPKSSLKQFGLLRKEKRKIPKPYSIKKSSKMKTETESSKSPEMSFSKVKPRYNQLLLFKKTDSFKIQAESEEGQFQDQVPMSVQNKKLSRSLNTPPESIPHKTAKSKFYNQNKPESSKTPLNMLQFSLKNLPIFSTDSLPQSSQMIAQQNHSLMMATMNLSKYVGSSQNSIEKQPRKDQNAELLRSNTVEFKLSQGKRGQIRRDLPFPFLCIMSETKKTEHISRLQQRKNVKKIKHISDCNKTQTIEKTETSKDGILTRLARERLFNSEAISKKMIDNFKKYQLKLPQKH